MGRQISAGWGKQAIFEQNASISLARWRWWLLHYFKQVVNLSATCFQVELEQFSACFRVARVCQRQLGFLVDRNDTKSDANVFFAPRWCYVWVVWEPRTVNQQHPLTLSRPQLPYGYSYKASCARPVKPSFVIFWHPGTLTLRADRQSAWMSKITNDGLTRSGTGCFIAVPI